MALLEIGLLAGDIAKGLAAGQAKNALERELTAHLDSIKEERDVDLLRDRLREWGERILAEAARWPAKKAVMIVPQLADDKVRGSWGVHDSEKDGNGILDLRFRILNRADMRIDVSKLRGRATVYGGMGDFSVDYNIDQEREETLGPRGELERRVRIRPATEWPTDVAVPRLGHRAARVELDLKLTAMGPWDGEGISEIEFNERLWVPMFCTFSGAANSPKYSRTDINLLIQGYLGRINPGGVLTVRFPEMEQEIRVPTGSTRPLLKQAASACGCELVGDLGDLVARVRRPRRRGRPISVR